MSKPTFQEEKKLWRKGYKNIVCLDEAGRGALCGPVVAGAVMIKISNFKFLISKQISNSKFQISKVNDSKKLSPKKREELYGILTKHPSIEWGVGIVSEKIIDKINILEATKLAMKKAVKNLKSKKILSSPPSLSLRENSVTDFLILDGKMKLNLPIPQKSIIKGDEKVFSCAAASIIAKVTRDRIMVKLAKKYPKYKFEIHKGYPTKMHLRLLKKYNPCKIHRKSFGPVRSCKPK